MGPDGVWVGVAPPLMDPTCIVGDTGAGWALHSDGDKRFDGKEEEYAAPFKNGDVLTVSLDVRKVGARGQGGVPGERVSPRRSGRKGHWRQGEELVGCAVP